MYASGVTTVGQGGKSVLHVCQWRNYGRAGGAVAFEEPEAY